MRILWVCPDEARLLDCDLRALERLGGFLVEHVACASTALEALRVSTFDAVLADLPLEDWAAEEWLEAALRAAPQSPILLRRRNGSYHEAIRLARLGASGYFDRHAPLEQIRDALEDSMPAGPAPAAAAEPWREMLVGGSRAMEQIAATIRLVGPRRSTVLITGETGTGKELVARAVHQASTRAHLPMVAVNCNALPATLLEAELFGHVRGAFTGAVNARTGRFEQANRSTLLLDEIGDVPLELQAKLLRVLQEREIERLGSSEPVRIDVRIIAATNADLAERMREGRFREDLFYRLNVVSIRVPPLRDRRTDIPALVSHFIAKFCREEGLPAKRAGRDTLARLCDYSWPGNVRQLEHAVETAVVLSGERRDLYPSDFPLPMQPKPAPAHTPSIRLPDDGLDFERTVGRIERSILEQALARTSGNKKAAAEMLRLKRTTFAAKLKSLDEIAV